MDTLSSLQRRTLFLDSIIIIFSFFGVLNVVDKSAFPFEIEQKPASIIITSVNKVEPDLLQNDKIIKVDEIEISNVEQIEIILDSKIPGDIISIEIIRENKTLSKLPKLVPFYSATYIIISSLTGIMFILVAIFILVKCEDKHIAGLAHWAFMFTAIIILMTWGSFSNQNFNLGIITRCGFHLGYLFAPLYFLKFSFAFPSTPKFNYEALEKILLGLAVLLFLLVNTAFVLLTKNITDETINLYITAFNICSLFLVILIFAAIGNFILSYITSNSETERKKLRWILLGFIIGPLGYLTLWVIPSRIWNITFVSEEVVLLLIAVVPITFAIAIVKYRLLDIDLIFRRGLVYFVAISILLISYITFLSILAIVFNNPDSQTLSILAAVSVALLFQPLKQMVQNFVDKKFFRKKYDYRQAIKLFNNQIEKIYNRGLLFDRAIKLINDLIPIKQIGFYELSNDELKLIKGHNIKLSLQNLIRKLDIYNALENNLPISPSGNIEAGVEVYVNGELNQLAHQIDLIFNIHSSDGDKNVFLAIGEKRNEGRFTAEDIDLLATISSRLSLIIERINLQEEIIREHMEFERLEELNKMKSFFVSSVSHDLKTPLTSIRLFVDRLKTKNLDLSNKQKYLNIIEGESIRLSKLIDNVLDFAKIERGTRDYKLNEIDLISVMKKVLENIEYQFSMGNYNVSVNIGDKEAIILADEGAIIQTIENIISNAMKYCGKEKQIEIKEYSNKNNVFVEVKDDGEGILKKELENIFQPFYRSKENSDQKIGGAGLGLAIAKHIMSAHNGNISVESCPGKGSKFSLIFPKV